LTPSERLKYLAIQRANTPEYLREMLAQVLSYQPQDYLIEKFSYSMQTGEYKYWTVSLLEYEGDFDGI
jgi:hypothetical protein